MLPSPNITCTWIDFEESIYPTSQILIALVALLKPSGNAAINVELGLSDSSPQSEF